MFTALQEESSDGVKPCSPRGIALTLDRSVRKMHKILGNILHRYHYKLSHLQKLFSSHQPARETFALEFLDRMKVDKEWPWKIFHDFPNWTDEAIFIQQDMLIHRTAEYGQYKIHWKLNLLHFILQRSLCGFKS